MSTTTIENKYVGDGSTVLYSFTFPYIDTADIKVSLDEVDTTEYTLANATTVEFNTAPVDGVAIRIYRNTSVEDPKAIFFQVQLLGHKILMLTLSKVSLLSKKLTLIQDSPQKTPLKLVELLKKLMLRLIKPSKIQLQLLKKQVRLKRMPLRLL
jgi:hypothetical protein